LAKEHAKPILHASMKPLGFANPSGIEWETFEMTDEMHPSNETTKSKTGYHWLLLAGQQQDEETSYH
jgi:hypothetical protein